MLDLILYPAHVANGTIERAQIMKRIMDSAKDCDLTPLDKLRFYRELEKAAGEAVKVKDEDLDMPVTDAALLQAEALPEVQKILADARAEELREEPEDKKKKKKKVFTYNGCKYVIKEDISIDMSDYNKFRGPEAVDWRKQHVELDTIEDKMADLRLDMSAVKTNMSNDEKKYFRAHPDCDRTIKRSVAVV